MLEVRLNVPLEQVTSIESLYGAIDNYNITKLIDSALNHSPKKVVYTSFDGDYLDYINHMTYIALLSGCTPINPECALGYFVSTHFHNGEKTETMQDCIALELICDEVWLFFQNPKEVNSYPEGIVAELLAWVKEKGVNSSTIRTYSADMLKAFTNLTRINYDEDDPICDILSGSYQYDNLSLYKLLEQLKGETKADIEKTLLRKVFKNKRRVVYAATNFFDIKYSDWLRSFCYQHNMVAIIPSQLMNSFVLNIVYREDLIENYLLDRLSLLNKVDTIYFVRKPYEEQNIYSIDFIFDYAFYLKNKETYEAIFMTWDEFGVPKFTNTNWALTEREKYEIYSTDGRLRK